MWRSTSMGKRKSTIMTNMTTCSVVSKAGWRWLQTHDTLVLLQANRLRRPSTAQDQDLSFSSRQAASLLQGSRLNTDLKLVRIFSTVVFSSFPFHIMKFIFWLCIHSLVPDERPLCSVLQKVFRHLILEIILQNTRYRALRGLGCATSRIGAPAGWREGSIPRDTLRTIPTISTAPTYSLQLPVSRLANEINPLSIVHHAGNSHLWLAIYLGPDCVWSFQNPGRQHQFQQQSGKLESLWVNKSIQFSQMHLKLKIEGELSAMMIGSRYLIFTWTSPNNCWEGKCRYLPLILMWWHSTASSSPNYSVTMSRWNIFQGIVTSPHQALWCLPRELLALRCTFTPIVRESSQGSRVAISSCRPRTSLEIVEETFPTVKTESSRVQTTLRNIQPTIQVRIAFIKDLDCKIVFPSEKDGRGNFLIPSIFKSSTTSMIPPHSFICS